MDDQDRILGVINEQLCAMTAITRPPPSSEPVNGTVNVPLEGELDGDLPSDDEDGCYETDVDRRPEDSSGGRIYSEEQGSTQRGTRRIAVAVITGNTAVVMQATIPHGMRARLFVRAPPQPGNEEESVPRVTHQAGRLAQSGVEIKELPSDTEEGEMPDEKATVSHTASKPVSEGESTTGETLPELVDSPGDSSGEEEENISLLPDPDEEWALTKEELEPEKRTFSVDSAPSRQWDKNATEKAKKKKRELEHDSEKDVDTTEADETFPTSSENEPATGNDASSLRNAANNQTLRNSHSRGNQSSDVEESSSNLPADFGVDPNTDPLLAMLSAFSRMQTGSRDRVALDDDEAESMYGGQCPYFMAGHCHRGSNCPLDHGLVLLSVNIL